MADVQSTQSCANVACVGIEYICKRCDQAFVSRHSHGRRPEYCSRACREPRPIREAKVAPAVKRCAGCEIVKPVADFIGRSDRPGKYQARCKVCVSQYMKTYYARTSGQRVEVSKAWYVRNRERALANNAKYRAMNPEKVRATKLSRRRRQATRCASFDAAQLEARLAMFSGCWMCGGPADTVDHVKPLAQGGSHMLANFRPACRPCNSRKAARWFGVANLAIFIKR